MGEELRQWRITVPGEPASQGSKRAFVNKRTGKVAMVDDDPRLKQWRGLVSLLMRRVGPREPVRAAVCVTFVHYVARPKAHYRTGRFAALLRADAPQFPATGRDLDKIQRAVGDAGTGVWWQDDDQIAQWCTARLFGEPERLEIAAAVLE